MVKVFDNGPGDESSITDWVIPKTKNIVLDTSLLNTQYYKLRIKGKVEQLGPPLHLGIVVIEKGALRSPSTTLANFALLFGGI